MIKNILGKTGISVTELCFGTLCLGPLQKNLSVEEGAALIYRAMEKGVNFFDTAESYQNYEYVAKAIKGHEQEVVIASKSTARSYDDMEKSIQKALKELHCNYIDIFHLHAGSAKSDLLQEREGAFRCLLDYKQKGYLRAVGVATHAVHAVSKMAEVPEVDIVFPLINKAGMGICDGTVKDMLAAIAKVAKAQKGLYAMKSLAGGHLIDQLPQAVNFVRQIPGMQAVAMGMVTEKELDINLAVFENQEIAAQVLAEMKNTKRFIFLSHVCQGCGACVKVCHSNAITIENGIAKNDPEKCILCGYCRGVCPHFAIRVV